MLLSEVDSPILAAQDPAVDAAALPGLGGPEPELPRLGEPPAGEIRLEFNQPGSLGIEFVKQSAPYQVEATAITLL